MWADDDDLEYLEVGQRVFDEKLERVGGVFVEPQHMQVDCNTEPGACAPDDYPGDPYAIDTRPGTPDDAGYSFGLTTRDAADHHIIEEGRSHLIESSALETDEDAPLGSEDEQDLWHHMERLVEADEKTALRLPEGTTEESGERVFDAAAGMGDDANGGSATGGADSEPEHGGFPERDG
jgi:hypothetical protein